MDYYNHQICIQFFFSSSSAVKSNLAGTKEELEELSKKLSKAISKKDFILAATIQRQLDEMEEQAAQKTNKFENLNKKLFEGISKKDYALALVLCLLISYLCFQISGGAMKTPLQ